MKEQLSPGPSVLWSISTDRDIAAIRPKAISRRLAGADAGWKKICPEGSIGVEKLRCSVGKRSFRLREQLVVPSDEPLRRHIRTNGPYPDGPTADTPGAVPSWYLCS